jgi:hypothetical protein
MTTHWPILRQPMWSSMISFEMALGRSVTVSINIRSFDGSIHVIAHRLPVPMISLPSVDVHAPMRRCELRDRHGKIEGGSYQTCIRPSPGPGQGLLESTGIIRLGRLAVQISRRISVEVEERNGRLCRSRY